MPFKSCSFCLGISFQEYETEHWQCPYCDSAIALENEDFEKPLKNYTYRK